MLTKPSLFVPTLALLLGATFTLSPARAQNVPMPESAITENTTFVLWMDSEHFTAEALRGAAKQVSAALPPQMQGQLDAKLNESIEQFQAGYDAFTNAGGQGMLVVMRSPREDGTTPRAATLLRVDEGTNPDDMAAAIQEVEGGRAPMLVKHEPGWLTHRKKLGQAATPTTGTAEQAEQFQSLFANTDSAPVRIAFRMTGALREWIAAQQNAGNQQGGMGGMGPAQALLGPAQSISGGWSTVEFGENPGLVSTIQFSDAQSAQRFRSAWEGLLMMGQGVLQTQLGNAPNAPEPGTVQGLFNQLKFQQDGEKLSAKLDTAFIQHAGKLAPAAQGLLMMMGGAGMGPGQQGGPGGPMPPPQNQQQ